MSGDGGGLMRQKLMAAEEVYVYKIPPLKTSGGHRAEDWNLASPLKTCSLLVERRGDCLVLEFTTGGKIFAESKIDVASDPSVPVKHWIEQVVDSSRYFALKIQGAGGREAMIGFGFRDRELATDLRESLQQYEKSIHREQKAGAKDAAQAPPQDASKKAVEKIAFQMGDIDLDAEHAKAASGDGDGDSSSGGAVFTGDEEQWATEFALK